MSEGSRGLREVAPNQSHPPQLREFTVSTGAAFSTLQDIKLPDSAGRSYREYSNAKCNDKV